LARVIDDTTLPNDKFGYRIYGVMAHLPEPQASEIRKFHKLVGADDLATKPHCSLDNFWGPDDLDAVKAAIAGVATRHRPFETEVDFSDTRIAEWGCAYTLKSVPDHHALHDALITALDPITKRIYSIDSDYWPHTTALLDAKPDEYPRIRPNLEKIDMTGSMRFETIELIGRIGPARGGEYEILASFPLGG
jgi:2'-5' RNA ligase